MPLITLITDFGTRDAYVGALKGALLSVCPGAILIDLAHDLEPQNIPHAALTVAGACPHFPAGTIHVVVVDPGVGSGRRLLACRIGDHVYLAPDNGVLTLALRTGPLRDCRAIENRRLFRSAVSRTFHGRDILAPVAGALASGLALDLVGPACEPPMRLNWPEAQRDAGRILGEVVAVDRYGNLITNIPAGWLPAGGGSTDAAAKPAGSTTAAGEMEVRMGPVRIRGLSNAYADAPAGAALAIIGSFDLLELAINCGNLAEQTGAGPGTGVEVRTGASAA